MLQAEAIKRTSVLDYCTDDQGSAGAGEGACRYKNRTLGSQGKN